jgi:hypothetical protein
MRWDKLEQCTEVSVVVKYSHTACQLSAGEWLISLNVIFVPIILHPYAARTLKIWNTCARICPDMPKFLKLNLSKVFPFRKTRDFLNIAMRADAPNFSMVFKRSFFRSSSRSKSSLACRMITLILVSRSPETSSWAVFLYTKLRRGTVWVCESTFHPTEWRLGCPYLFHCLCVLSIFIITFILISSDLFD